jgi:hypothetical protein
MGWEMKNRAELTYLSSVGWGKPASTYAYVIPGRRAATSRATMATSMAMALAGDGGAVCMQWGVFFETDGGCSGSTKQAVPIYSLHKTIPPSLIQTL